MKTLFVSDLDGTLLNSDAKISDFTLGNLNKLIEKGLPFALATSRSTASAKTIIDGLRLGLPSVMMNGVFVTDIATGEHKRINFFEQSAAQRVIDEFLIAGARPLFTVTTTAE